MTGTNQHPAPHPATPARIAGQWTIDSRETRVGIVHKTLFGLVRVTGAFTQTEGEAEITADGDVSGALRIAAASLDTKNKRRDIHLRSPDFFDVDQHPTILITVTSAHLDGDQVHLSCQVSIKDITEPRELLGQITTTGPADHPDRLTVSVDAVFDRTHFGMTWGPRMAPGPATASVHAVLTRSFAPSGS
jgi:polyisoprenoid-binding protein YceI